MTDETEDFAALPKSYWRDIRRGKKIQVGEWHYVRAIGGEVLVSEDWTGVGEDDIDPYGLAAVCLHEQPFGFTQEDVTALRDAALVVGELNMNSRLCSIADRIADLLPPA